MAIEAAHIAGSEGNTIVAAARQQKPNHYNGEPQKDRPVEDNAIAIVYGNTHEHSAIPGLLEGALTQVRNSGAYRGEHIGSTASVAALTTDGVDLHSAGDSIVAAIGENGEVSILNMLHVGDHQIVNDYIAPGLEILSKFDYTRSISWEEIEAAVGPNPTIAVITDGISEAHSKEQLVIDIQKLLEEVKTRWHITPDHPQFPALLIEASKTTENYRGVENVEGEKIDDTSVVTGRKPKDTSEQSVIGVFDGLGRGKAKSAKVAKEVAEAVRQQFVGNREYETVPVVATDTPTNVIRKAMKSALTQIDALGELSDYTAAQDLLVDAFIRIFKSNLSIRGKVTVINHTIDAHTLALPKEKQDAFLEKLNNIAGGGELPYKTDTPFGERVFSITKKLIAYSNQETLLDLIGNSNSRIAFRFLAPKLMQASEETAQENIIDPIARILRRTRADVDTKLEIIRDALLEAVDDLPLYDQTKRAQEIVRWAGAEIPDINERSADVLPSAARDYVSDAAKSLAEAVAAKEKIGLDGKPAGITPPERPSASYSSSSGGNTQKSKNEGSKANMLGLAAAGGAVITGIAAAALSKQNTNPESSGNDQNKSSKQDNRGLLKKGLIVTSVALGLIATGVLAKSLLGNQRKR